MVEALDYLIRKEPNFKKIIDTYGIPPIPRRPEGFETLVLLILEQQVSIDSAKATFLKLKAAVQKITPQELYLLTDEEYRNCGVSRQKASYIKGLSTAILEKTLKVENLKMLSKEEARSQLIQIKGIGNWTIDIYLMFCLQSPDIIPLGDIAVVNTIQELFGITQKEEMEKLTHHWSPYKSMATFLLWHHYLKKRNRKISYEIY